MYGVEIIMKKFPLIRSSSNKRCRAAQERPGVLKSIILWAFRESRIVSLLYSKRSARRGEKEIHASGARGKGSRKKRIKRTRKGNAKEIQRRRMKPPPAEHCGWSCPTQYYGVFDPSSTYHVSPTEPG